MSDQQQPSVPPSPPSAGASSLADWEWRRMHPLTPLFKGGLALIIVVGILIANMRDRVITWLVNLFAPEGAHYGDYAGADPVDWVFDNNFVLFMVLGLLALVAVLIAGFWLVWRFQQFRITGEHVEVRKGIVLRSHRRALLDRVQAVNLTRPFPARVIDLAKLEVIGAGTDANVALEYLATPRAEAVRADILCLASRARAARTAVTVGSGNADVVSPSARAQLIGSMNDGVTGLIAGVDSVDFQPESVVKIPTGRLVGSQLIAGVLWLLFFGTVFAVAMGSTLVGFILEGDPAGGVVLLGIALAMGIPLFVAIVGITWAQISKSLRYSIAPTPDGVRITYGLLTTVIETLPPGRIFAVEVSQSLLWRPFGWWTIKINRMSGKSVAQQQSGSAQQFNVVLPVGKRADVERVLGLILPDMPAVDIPLIWEHGILGPGEGDPYRTMPARAWWRRQFSWRRHGYALTDFGVLLRRGTVWRKLAIFPLARVQGLSLSQGPVDRAQQVAGAQVHTVPGPITGFLSGLERADALALFEGVSQSAVAAAGRDHSYRWGEHASVAVLGYGAVAAAPWAAAPLPPVSSVEAASWAAPPPPMPPAPPSAGFEASAVAPASPTPPPASAGLAPASAEPASSLIPPASNTPAPDSPGTRPKTAAHPTAAPLQKEGGLLDDSAPQNESSPQNDE